MGNIKDKYRLLGLGLDAGMEFNAFKETICEYMNMFGLPG